MQPGRRHPVLRRQGRDKPTIALRYCAYSPARREPLQVGIEVAAAAAAPGRPGQPNDIADIVAFLASPSGHWIIGQTVRANGGLI